MRWIAFSSAILAGALALKPATLEAQKHERAVLIDQQATAEAAKDGGYYALIIGINAYLKLPADKQLKTAAHDAQSIAEVLHRSYGFQVKSLIDADATRDNIIDQIEQYRANLQPTDNLVIYYAGHGYLDKATGEAYWLPTDATQTSRSHWISADDITRNLGGFASRHILVISDSCYSGAITRALEGEGPVAEHVVYLEKQRQGKSRTLMASGGAETVADEGPEGHSVFAYALLQALTKVPDSEFAAGDLFTTLIKERVGGSAKQLPLYSWIQDSGHESGDFVFLRVGSSIAAKPAPPPAPLVKVSPEELARTQWEKLHASNNRDLLSTYILMNSNSPYATQAKRQVEDLDWNAANNSKDRSKLMFYINQHSTGVYLQQAYQQLEEKDWSDAIAKGDRDSLERFLNEYQSSRFAGQARDLVEQMDWKAVDHSGNVQGLQAFLVAHPNGHDADAAKSQLAALDLKPTMGGSDDENIRGVINLYARAFQSKDIVQLRHVWPTITDKEFKNMANTMKAADSIAITIEPSGDPAVNGGNAHVSCVQTASFTVSGQKQQVHNSVDFQMEKMNDGQWVIGSAQYSKGH